MKLGWRRPTAGCQLGSDREAGAALVEFVLVLPIFMALVLAMFTGGLAYNHKQEITNAAREAARYGATLVECDASGSTAPQCAGGNTWTSIVQGVAVDRANGSLTASQVCVALVKGPADAPTVISYGGDTLTTAAGSAPCYTDDSTSTTDLGTRVQVSVSRSDNINFVYFSQTLALTAQGTASFEPAS